MKRKRDDQAWLQDIVASIEAIEAYTTKLNAEEFIANSQIQLLKKQMIEILNQTN